jgi:hypothetical protein
MFVCRVCAYCSVYLSLRSISRQFIARYVHDLIVKHNVRDRSGHLAVCVLTFSVSAAEAAMGRERLHQ